MVTGEAGFTSLHLVPTAAAARALLDPVPLDEKIAGAPGRKIAPVNINVQSDSGTTPLFEACQYDRAGVVEELLTRRADPNCQRTRVVTQRCLLPSRPTRARVWRL